MSNSGFILASASPRRQQLLRDAGYHFRALPADIDEADYPRDLSPADVALHLARAKARKIAQEHPDTVVLAADTVVAFGEQLLGKPDDATDARRILELLSGTVHIVITGVCVIHVAGNFNESAKVMSAVRMKSLTPNDIDKYLLSGQWQGKAGAYGIQDRDPFVTKVTGSFTNIVGLPMAVTRSLLLGAGIQRAEGVTED